MNRSLRLLTPARIGLAPQHRALLALRPARRADPAPVLFKRYLSTTPSLKDNTNTTSRAKDEVKGVAKDFAEMVSGKSTKGPSDPSAPSPADGAREISSHSHAGNAMEDFYSITRDMFQTVPKPALYFGLAGTLPYLGTSAATIFLAREASLASTEDGGLTAIDLPTALSYLHTMEHVQITYGAIILSFLGAIHWGMEFSKYGGSQGYARLALGTVPVLLAWPTTFLSHGLALSTQWIGFTGMWFLDQRASTAGWTPHWYSTYRFYLSLVVGFSIIATLAGTGYYGAGAGAVNQSTKHLKHTTERVSSIKRLDRVKNKNSAAADPVTGKMKGKVAGDMQVDENEGEDSYLKLRNIKAEKEAEEEEEEKKKEEEEEEKQKTAEKQDKKDEHQQDKAPGTMKEDAKDRTGKNANQPGGEEKEDEGGEDKDNGAGDEGKPEEEKGKSQAKLDNPDAKGEAGKPNTGKK